MEMTKYNSLEKILFVAHLVLIVVSIVVVFIPGMLPFVV